MNNIQKVVKEQAYLDVDECLEDALWTKIHWLTRPAIADTVRGKVWMEMHDRWIINE